MVNFVLVDRHNQHASIRLQQSFGQLQPLFNRFSMKASHLLCRHPRRLAAVSDARSNPILNLSFYPAHAHAAKRNWAGGS